MRISNLTQNNYLVNQSEQITTDINKSMQNISTGKRIHKSSDDPSAFSQIDSNNTKISTLENYDNNSSNIINLINIQDSTIQEIEKRLIDYRSKLTQLNNASLSTDDRNIILKTLSENSNTIRSLMNTTDSNNQAIFAGTNTTSIVYDSNNVFYGSQKSNSLQISDNQSMQYGLNAYDLFEKIPNGQNNINAIVSANNTGSAVLSNTAGTSTPTMSYTLTTINNAGSLEWNVVDNNTSTSIASIPISNTSVNFNGITLTLAGTPNLGDTIQVGPSTNVSLLQTLNTFENSYLNNNTKTDQQNKLNKMLNEMDSIQSNIEYNHAKLGQISISSQNQIDINESYIIDLKNAKSSLEDTDMTKEISNLQQLNTIKDALYKTYSQMNKSSLFNYIG